MNKNDNVASAMTFNRPWVDLDIGCICKHVPFLINLVSCSSLPKKKYLTTEMLTYVSKNIGQNLECTCV